MKARTMLVVLAAAVFTTMAALAGCTEADSTVARSPASSPSPTPTDSTTGAGTRETYVHQAITSRWPPGIHMVVLDTETGLYAVDAAGVSWAIETRPSETSTTVTVRGVPVVSGLDGRAVSRGHEFIAGIEDGREIVVRSIMDGSIVQRAEVRSQGHATLRSINSDGTLAALVTVDPRLESTKASDEVPWVVTVVDLTSGTATVENTLGGFVQGRIEGTGRCGLTALDWLPGGKMIIGMSGDPYEVYLYDPATDSLELNPGLWYVRDVAPGGLVLGQSTANLERAAVWNSSDGSFEPVIPDPLWPSAGTGSFNAAGTMVALSVGESSDWEAGHGWQVFHRIGFEWRPAGPIAVVNWMNQPPTLLSSDGSKAWTVAYQSTDENETTLISHDFRTGAWETWFRSEDLRVEWGDLYFAAIVPED